jgi:FtsH-binding integral membrane protein
MASERRWHSLATLLLHVILLGFAFGIGFLLEALFSRYYQGSHIAAFSPCIAVTAFVIAYFANRRRRDRSPLLFAVAGVLWLAFAVWGEGRAWDPTWAHESKSNYLVHMFFGTPEQCSASECIGELFFTAPCMAAVAYSIGAAVGSVSPKK